MIAEFSETVAARHDLPRRTYLFDLDGEALLRHSSDGHVRYAPLSRFPVVTRDLAPVLARSVAYTQVEATTREAAGPLLDTLRLVDVYEGANLGENRRSLTLRLTFRSADRTLTDTEVEQALAHVRTALVETLGADLRG